MATSPTPPPEPSLYQAHEKIYPREVSGYFTRLRVISLLTLLGIYYITPLLQWNGRQAILFDLPARQFHIFGLTLWPQDFIYLVALLILAGLALFFFTAMLGRVWCGYACPQTVWTEAFIWMERKIEGNRGKRMKLDKAPTTAAKIRTKILKHTVWIAFSLWTGFTFVAYFTPIKELANELITFSLGPWETFWILFYSFATYGNAGFMREQVCKYMCPYARFQGAMFDSDTLIVAYHPERGEQVQGHPGQEAVAGTGSQIDFTSETLTASKTYNVYASATGTCSLEMSYRMRRKTSES